MPAGEPTHTLLDASMAKPAAEMVSSGNCREMSADAKKAGAAKVPVLR